MKITYYNTISSQTLMGVMVTMGNEVINFKTASQSKETADIINEENIDIDKIIAKILDDISSLIEFIAANGEYSTAYLIRFKTYDEVIERVLQKLNGSGYITKYNDAINTILISWE